MAMTMSERLERYPQKRFTCAWCKNEVVTDSTEKVDKRTRFCCARCERKYWKKTKHRRKEMDKQDIAEQAYKNGYEQGKTDTAKEILSMFDDRNYISESELKKAIAKRFGVKESTEGVK